MELLQSCSKPLNDVPTRQQRSAVNTSIRRWSNAKVSDLCLTHVHLKVFATRQSSIWSISNSAYVQFYVDILPLRFINLIHYDQVFYQSRVHNNGRCNGGVTTGFLLTCTDPPIQSALTIFSLIKWSLVVYLTHWGQVTHMCLSLRQSLVMTMACHLVSTKPSSETMLEYC